MRSSNTILSAALPLFLCLISIGMYAQQKALNIVGIHQLVANSKSENELQRETRDRQSTNTITEEVNKRLLVRLQDKYTMLQSRFNLLHSVISAADIGLEAVPLVDGVISDQATLFVLARKNPMLLKLVYDSEIELLIKAKDLLYYLIGLSASFGAVNAMKPSDRKLLFEYAISELRRLKGISSGLIGAISSGSVIGILKGIDPFSDYINADRSLASQILLDAKYLRQ